MEHDSNVWQKKLNNEQKSLYKQCFHPISELNRMKIDFLFTTD